MALVSGPAAEGGKAGTSDTKRHSTTRTAGNRTKHEDPVYPDTYRRGNFRDCFRGGPSETEGSYWCHGPLNRAETPTNQSEAATLQPACESSGSPGPRFPTSVGEVRDGRTAGGGGVRDRDAAELLEAPSL